MTWPTPETDELLHFDIVYVNDFRLPSESTRRIVEETRMNAALGYRTALVHVTSTTGAETAIAPAVVELIESNLAIAAEFDSLMTASLAIVANATVTLNKHPRLPVRIIADQVLAIADEITDQHFIDFKHQRLVELFGNNVSWTATTFDALIALRSTGVRTLGTMWQSFGHANVSPDRYVWAEESRPLVGVAVDPGADHWPGDRSVCDQIWDTDRYRVRVIGTPPQGVANNDWEILPVQSREHLCLVTDLSAFLYYPDGRPATLPMTAIGTCLANDIPVFLPPHLKGAIGKGPLYVEPGKVQGELENELFSANRPSVARFDPMNVHRRRMRFWMKDVRAPALSTRKKRVMLFSSNGEGLGHITRLLSVARKLPAEVVPVFASLSSAIGLVRDAGFEAEMILSHRYAGIEEARIYPWMAEELKELLRRHNPDVFVFDGGNPYSFMTEIVARRRGTSYLWMRRGMWRKEQDNSFVLNKGKFFDGIIEPLDLASAVDQGATTNKRDGTVPVDPIRLIDRDEQLSRNEARVALGLDLDRPAVLIQLGPGMRQDLTITFRRVLDALEAHGDIQIVNLNAPIGKHYSFAVDHVTDVAVYPIARYLNAFDFSVSAAGYNSFHELITSRVPALFVVSMTAELDDQYGRAVFAERNGCAFALSDDELSLLPHHIEQLMNEDVRRTMRQACERLQCPNGAKQAADLIAEYAL